MASAQKGRNRRGNAAISALVLTGLLGFGALAVDMAWIRVINAQLTAAGDAGALGGAGYLDGTPQGVARAVHVAVDIANQNPIFVRARFTPEHVEVGQWDPEARTFTALTAGEAEIVDAVRVTIDLPKVPAVLAGVAFGTYELSTASLSVAHRPLHVSADELECYLPLALPTCMFPDSAGTNPPPLEVNLGDSNTDNVGWAMPGGVNASDVNTQLVDGCTQGSLSTGDVLELQNGVVSSAIQTIGNILNGQRGAADAWPEDTMGAAPDRADAAVAFPQAESLVHGNRWGHVLQGPIALVDLGGEPGSCVGMQPFNGPYTVEGFTWGALYDARQGDQAGFMLQLDFVNEHLEGTSGSTSAIGNVTGPGSPTLVL